MTATVQSIDLISTDPKVRGGRPCIAGTGLEVSALVIAKLFHQISPEQLAADYGLSLAQVYAAFAYYYENKESMNEMMRQQLKFAAELKEKRVGSRHPPLFG